MIRIILSVVVFVVLSGIYNYNQIVLNYLIIINSVIVINGILIK